MQTNTLCKSSFRFIAKTVDRMNPLTMEWTLISGVEIGVSPDTRLC
jgi:hypothetical protein